MSAKYKAKGMLRAAKNFTKGYSEIEIKVRDATSNDPWGPSAIMMDNVGRFTFDEKYVAEIMQVLYKRLDDKGKNWRHVYKSLILLNYLLHSGSEWIINSVMDNMFKLKTLIQFQYVDETGRDHGVNVRIKARELVDLMEDMDRLFKERENAPIPGEYQTNCNTKMKPSSFSQSKMLYNELDDTNLQEKHEIERAIEESKISETERIKKFELEEQQIQTLIKENKDPIQIKEARKKSHMDDLIDLFDENTTTQNIANKCIEDNININIYNKQHNLCNELTNNELTNNELHQDINETVSSHIFEEDNSTSITTCLQNDTEMDPFAELASEAQKSLQQRKHSNNQSKPHPNSNYIDMDYYKKPELDQTIYDVKDIYNGDLASNLYTNSSFDPFVHDKLEHDDTEQQSILKQKPSYKDYPDQVL